MMAHVTDRQQQTSVANPQQFDTEGNFFTFARMRALVTRYQRVWVAAVGLSSLLAVVWVAIMQLTQPSSRVSSLPFRLTFEGAKEGRYPGGLPFSTTDLINPEVLRLVYDRNELQQYVDVDRFMSSMYVRATSPQVEILNAEYRAKLAEPRLSPVDREKMEEEYLQRLAALVLQNELVMVSPSTASRLPTILVDKVLNDTMAEWARQAVEVRGVALYDIGVATEVASDVNQIASRPFIQQVDLLRAKLQRLSTNLLMLIDLPGGNVFREAPGKLSLRQRRALVEEFLTYRLEPLYRLVRTPKLDIDSTASLRYLESRRAQAQDQADLSRAHVQASKTAIETYMTGDSAPRRPSGTTATPAQGGTGSIAAQLDGDVLQTLLSMGRQSEDLEFRQEKVRSYELRLVQQASADAELDFYNRALEHLRAPAPVLSSAAFEEVEETLADAKTLLLESATEVETAFRMLSELNLNPRGALYAIAGPFQSTTVTPVSLRTRVMVALLALLAFNALVVVGILAHASVRS
jgi:hypothetical protein